MPPLSTPILIVDDDQEDLELTRVLLNRAKIGDAVVSATGGEEAIELLTNAGSGEARRVPMLVLCDVRMPKVGGFDVLKWVRNQPAFSAIYFAMHSGGDVPADRARALSLGADEYLVKFPTQAEITKIARLAHEKHAAMTQADESPR